MKRNVHQKDRIILLLPVAGILLFVLLYVLAARFYPGGSQANRNAAGFSWVHNYWCNLLSDTAINGRPNPAKPLAMTGMFVLCLSLSLFWYIFPILTNTSKRMRIIIQVPGILAMTIAFLLFTRIDHDGIINFASSFGLLATGGTLVTVYRQQWRTIFLIGLLNPLLVLLNNYVYHTKGMIVYLPLVQKISFASFLFWIGCVAIRLWRVIPAPGLINAQGNLIAPEHGLSLRSISGTKNEVQPSAGEQPPLPANNPT